MVSISNKSPSVVRTNSQPTVAPTTQPTSAPSTSKGWAPSNTPRPVATPSTPAPVQASVSGTTVPIGPFATGVSTLAKAILDDSDPVSTSLTSNAAVDQLTQSAMAVLQRELNERGEMGAAVTLSKQFAAIPAPVTDRQEPMETVATNSERANAMYGLLEKFSAAMGRIPQATNDPTASMQSRVVSSSNTLVKAEVDLGLALNKAYAQTGDPAVAEKTQAFLEQLPARVAKGTESITELGPKLEAKNMLAAALINEFAKSLVAE